jgi:hypothetical protein
MNRGLSASGFYHFPDKHFLTWVLSYLALGEGDVVVTTALFFFLAFFFCFSVFFGLLSPIITISLT